MEIGAIKIFLCSEVVRELDFLAQCRFARDIGYDGLELAPFLLGDDPANLAPGPVAELRRIAEGEGVAISGLHWLMAAPAGLSITADDDRVADGTLEVGRRLVALCASLGGRYLIHGSPGQRVLEPGHEAQGRRRAERYFAQIAEVAEGAGVRYIIEPLSRIDTGYVNSVEEALALIEDIGSPALATMVDCYAAATNGEDIPALLARHVPAGAIRHVHFNDDNKRGPGEGGIDFAAILDMLVRLDYAGTAAVEPFIYVPDGQATAARSVGYLRGLSAALR